MNKLDRIGTFHARAVEWGVRPNKDPAVSKSVEVAIHFEIQAELQKGGADTPDEWAPWPADYGVYGSFYVIGKKGQPNQSAVDQLVEVLGWDGSLETVASGSPPDDQVTITVETNEYPEGSGKIQYRVGWLRPFDWEGSGGGIANAADLDEVKALQARHGSLLRAAAAKKGGAASSKAAPAARPATPPAAANAPPSAKAAAPPDSAPPEAHGIPADVQMPF